MQTYTTVFLEVRKLAFEMAAVKYNLARSRTWSEKEMAEDCFRSFMQRNPQLSIGTAQATSLARTTSFNRTNVNAFYDNLQKVVNLHTFEARRLSLDLYDG